MRVTWGRPRRGSAPMTNISKRTDCAITEFFSAVPGRVRAEFDKGLSGPSSSRNVLVRTVAAITNDVAFRVMREESRFVLP